MLANPDGLTVRSGSATFTINGNNLDISVSRNAFLDWRSFNLAPGDSTTFHQPSAASIVWNRISDPNPSQIYGRISANGIVVLMNQAGFYFGPGSVVNAAGFVATTATTLPEFSSGGVWQFHGPPPLASIVNYGEIRVNSGGNLFLLAEKIENHGTLVAPDGTLGLYAGKQVTMSERPDGRGLSVNVRLPEGSVDNHGRLIADGGSIFLHAQTINQAGLVQANSVRERNGVIELIASDHIELGADSLLSARGDSDAVSSGGQITVKSEGTFTDVAGSRVDIGGGGLGGNGGHAELSAPFMGAIHSAVDGRAVNGFLGGRLLIDPTDIVLNTTGTGSANGGRVGANDPPTTLYLNVNSAFTGLSSITLQATHNISLAAGTLWDLAQSTGISAPGCQLTLQAGNDLIFEAGSSLVAGRGWGVSLAAGVDFSVPDGFKPNAGNITFQSIRQTDGTWVGSSFVAEGGPVSMRGGKNITLQTGSSWLLNAGDPGNPSRGFQAFAGGDMVVQSGALIRSSSDWSLDLAAGVDFTTPGAFKPNVGNITFQGSTVISGTSVAASSLEAGGSVSIRAGNSLTLGAGATWTLDAVTGGAPLSHLLAQAGGNLTLQTGAGIHAGAGWTVDLSAGTDYSAPNAFKTSGDLIFQSGTGLDVFGGATHLRAGGNITLQSSAAWTFGSGVNPVAAATDLLIAAGGNIRVQNLASIRAGYGWSASLLAGADFSTPGTVRPGFGSIIFEGSGSLEGRNRSLNLQAGQNVTVAGGFVRTISGGNIDVTAVDGNVDTGTRQRGFQFFGLGSILDPSYLQVDPDLGGISTMAGGNLTITAGQNITSYLPTGLQTLVSDAGSGAFGAAAGNVTLRAGGDITGHYVVRNGTGYISAGRNAGTAQKQLALSLVRGGWEVHGQDVILQEVRNPNGIFNSLNYQGRSATPTRHYFDYAPDAYVKLFGVNSVQLLGANLPRRAGTFEQAIPILYAPSLEIHAGAGGVNIGNDVCLFPSPIGHLRITTTGGGSLTGGSAGELVNIIMSDSGRRQYTSPDDFGANDHATTPLHINDPEPVRLEIAGNMTDIMLVSPTRTEITVGGNMVNSRFSIQNLHPGDTTRLTVAGDILNRNEFTTIALGTAPDFSYFTHTYPELTGGLAGLPGRFSFNAQTHTLTFRGRMSTEEYQTLLALQVQAIDSAGHRLFDNQGNPILQTVNIIPPSVLQALFDASQDIPSSPGTGYIIAGPGSLNINARNLDLGATLGIQSVGPLYNHALARLGSSGAAINVNLTGNLDMFSTTISSIAGGNVFVYAGGYINVGSTVFTGDQLARGIFTVARSDVTVIAGGDINVNGSRIAAYDGGNIIVRSLTGNVDAGRGGQGAAEVTEVYVDPVTGAVLTYTPTIPGSGILATTFPPPLDPAFPRSRNPVGNILIETPRGNIIASAGGIVQVPLNRVNSSSATVTLIAGSRDSQGRVLYLGSIDASGSGVIGANVDLRATGGIRGLVVASHNINITALQNVNVTAIGSGNVSVSAGGTISGTIVGVGSVSANANSIDASLLSQNVSASGNTAGAQVGFAQGNAAGATSQSALNSEEDSQKATKRKTDEDEDEKKKQGGGTGPALAKRVGRVTVVLPKG